MDLEALVTKSLLKAATRPVKEHFEHEIEHLKHITKQYSPAFDPNETPLPNIQHAKQQWALDLLENKQHVDAAHDELIAHRGKRAIVDRDHIADYTHFGSGALNRKLIKPEVEGLYPHERLHKGLQEAMRKAPALHRDVHVYNGTAGYDPTKLMQTGMFHTPAYISSSIDPRLAMDFAYGHMIHFHLPKGFKNGMYIGDISAHKKEHEFLLNAGQKWKVTGHTIAHPFRREHPDNALHIWSVTPHEESVSESFTHSKRNVAFKDTESYGIGDEDDFQQIPAVESEHEHLATLHKTPNDEACSAFSNYACGSDSFNEPLIKRHSMDIGVKRNHTTIQKVFSSNPGLIKEHHVYSGISFDPSRHFKKAGGIFRSPAYISSSLHPSVAARHLNSKKDKAASNEHFRYTSNGTEHMLHFILPKGYTGGRYIGHHSDFRNEYEMVLNRGQKFKLVGHHEINAKRSIENWDIKTGRYKPSYTPITRHIWSVTPHEAKNPVTESYKHHSGKTLWSNTHELFPARQALNPKLEDEHNALMALHNHEKFKGTTRNLFKEELSFSDPDRYEKWGDVGAEEIRHYAGTGSGEINSLLTKPSLKDNEVSEYWKPKIKKIDSFLNLTRPLETPIHTYASLGKYNPVRAMGLYGSKMDQGRFKTKAFISSSLDPEIAVRHANMKFPLPDREHILHFTLPKGYTGGRYIAGIGSPIEGEHEFLFKRGQKFKITGKTDYDLLHKGFSKKPRIRTIWHAEPLEHLESVTEMFTHSIHPYFQNVKHITPAQEKPIDAGYEGEHSLLTAQHQKIANKYKGDVRRFSITAHDINRILIGGPIRPDHFGYGGKKLLPLHQNIQKMFTEVPGLQGEHHVYSGMGDFNPVSHFKRSQTGVFRIPTYVSTSIAPEVAVRHSNLKSLGVPEDEHILHFHLPKGYNQGLYIANQSAFPGEREMMLNAGQKFKLVKHQAFEINKYSKETGIQAKRHIWSVVPHEEPVTEMYKPLNTGSYKKEFSTSRLVGGGSMAYPVNSEVDDIYDEPQHIIKQHNQLYNLHGAHFTEDQNLWSTDYTGGAAHELNGALLDKLNKTEQYLDRPLLRGMDSFFKGKHKIQPLDHDVHAYSGISFDPKHIFKGKKFKSPAFVSSSLNPLIAYNVGFAHTIEEPKKDIHILHYHLPKGYEHGAYLGGTGEEQYLKQREMVINRNTTFELHNKTMHKNKKHTIHIWHVKPA